MQRYGSNTQRIYRSVGLFALVVLLGFQVSMASGRQYIVVNLHGSEVNDTVFRQLVNLRGEKGTAAVDIGVAAIFSYLHQPPEKLCKHLEAFLELSEKYSLPVVVQLDGEQWWGARPDLWNWWDAERAGYDPKNRANVEWSSWDKADAVKIAWRNWGRQIRVLPPPNMMSRRYQAACETEMRRLIPVVLKWWRQLPADKKHLFIGIKMGWESSVGVGSFYYPDGNALLDRPQQDDPTYGLTITDLPGRGVAPIGYAAVRTAGLAKSGDLSEAHLAEVTRQHLEGLCRIAAEEGVPRDRLFTHAGGWKDRELLYDSAVNEFSSPGWSFYKHAKDPAQDKGVRRALRKSDAFCWGAVEWLPVDARDVATWKSAFDNTLIDPRCRYLCIYNWRRIKNNDAVLQAIRSVLAEPLKLGLIRPSADGSHFVREDTGERFVVWGFNYDHDAPGRLLEDYWVEEWAAVEGDFKEMKALGANVVRVHLQVAKFMQTADEPNTASLRQLTRLLKWAEKQELYLDITGLGCYHKQDVPVWYDALDEAERWDVQARFWEAIAKTCTASPAIFCYDLMNEPIVSGGAKKETDWLGGAFAGKYFVQRISLDLAGRTSKQVAEAWVNKLVSAIRKHDAHHMVTVGVIPWAHTWPNAKPLFYSEEVSRNLDFVSVHFYPKKGEVKKALDALAVYEIGKPLIVEEMFPLNSGIEDMDAFIDGSRKFTDGWIGFYWGRTIEEYAEEKNDIGAAITKGWLEYFKKKADDILSD